MKCLHFNESSLRSLNFSSAYTDMQIVPSTKEMKQLWGWKCLRLTRSAVRKSSSTIKSMFSAQSAQAINQSTFRFEFLSLKISYIPQTWPLAFD